MDRQFVRDMMARDGVTWMIDLPPNAVRFCDVVMRLISPESDEFIYRKPFTAMEVSVHADEWELEIMDMYLSLIGLTQDERLALWR